MVNIIQIQLPTPIKGIEIIAIQEFIECTNPEIIDIFNYYRNQRKYSCLRDKDITLCEQRVREGINEGICGEAVKTGENQYQVSIDLENINWCKEKGNHISLEHVIRHELNHIRFGDCDKELPHYLDKLHRNLIAEPRAELYALFNL